MWCFPFLCSIFVGGGGGASKILVMLIFFHFVNNKLVLFHRGINFQ